MLTVDEFEDPAMNVDLFKNYRCISSNSIESDINPSSIATTVTDDSSSIIVLNELTNDDDDDDEFICDETLEDFPLTSTAVAIKEDVTNEFMDFNLDEESALLFDRWTHEDEQRTAIIQKRSYESDDDEEQQTAKKVKIIEEEEEGEEVVPSIPEEVLFQYKVVRHAIKTSYELKSDFVGSLEQYNELKNITTDYYYKLFLIRDKKHLIQIGNNSEFKQYYMVDLPIAIIEQTIKAFYGCERISADHIFLISISQYDTYADRNNKEQILAVKQRKKIHPMKIIHLLDFLIEKSVYVDNSNQKNNHDKPIPVIISSKERQLNNFSFEAVAIVLPRLTAYDIIQKGLYKTQMIAITDQYFLFETGSKMLALINCSEDNLNEVKIRSSHDLTPIEQKMNQFEFLENALTSDSESFYRLSRLTHVDLTITRALFYWLKNHYSFNKNDVFIGLPYEDSSKSIKINCGYRKKITFPNLPYMYIGRNFYLENPDKFTMLDCSYFFRSHSIFRNIGIYVNNPFGSRF